jgi:lipid II isoglutaminyl synthase (glutamine-hydrolysing)
VFRLVVAIAAARLVGRLSRLFGRGGSAIPGLVAGKIAPATIERLARSIGGGVVVVTGSNGKTTTTKMIVSILEATGMAVVTNRSGSNLERGVAGALIDASTWTGSIRGDIAVFEIDEAAARGLGPRLTPRLVVVTNLVRDQLDRYGELDTTAGHVTAVLDHAAAAVLNADDPLVAGLPVRHAPTLFGAVEELRALVPPDRDLHGDAAGAAGDVVPHVRLLEATPDGDAQRVRIEVDGGDPVALRLGMPGVYNAYNAAAAMAAVVRLGVDPAAAAQALETMEAPFGRGQVIEFRGRSVVVLLVKNPAGLNQAVRVLAGADRVGPVLVAINDNHADGRDVSWLWDARVEDLAGTGHQFIAGGTRAADMALRFKYAGIDAKAEPDLARALDLLVEGSAPGHTVYVVPTYTAMLALLDTLLPGVPRHEVWT